MSKLLAPDELDHWLRTGRGHRLDFFATDQEIQEWLLPALPIAYKPYTLVGADSIKLARFHYVAKPFEHPVSEFLQSQTAIDGKPRCNYWIRSERLTPSLPLQPDVRLSQLCSLSGLVGLQHGCLTRVRNPRDPATPLYQNASSIGIVTQVHNPQTDEIRHYPEYLEIFEALRKRIRKSLVHTTITRFADGSEREDPLLRMTQAAKELYDQGHPFINRPGQFIGKKGK